jgi:basic amino acid/polyamine antiporter, APA family
VIGLGRATAMVIGIIIGASIFVQPSVISGDIPSAGGVLVVWIVAGALTLIGALVAAELASAWPQTGGVYVFLREAWSPALAFLWGWAMFWSMHSAIIAIIAMVFARYAGAFVTLGDGAQRVVAVAAILGLSAVNYVGARQGSAIQTGLTVIKVLALVGIVAIGAGVAAGLLIPATAGGSPLAVAAGAAAWPGPGPGAWASAVGAGLFAFGGWHMVTYAAGETVDPARTIPRALVIGTVAVTVLYVAANAAYFAVLSPQAVAASSRVAADFAVRVLGPWGGGAVSAMVMLSTLGAVAGIILAGPRVYLSMAADGLLVPWAGAVHPRFGTPHRAIALQAVWASVLVATGTYRGLFTRVVYTEWIFFALMAAGLFRLRRRPGYAPAFRLWGFPVLPAIFIGAAAAIVVHQLVAEPGTSAVGLGIVAAGLPVYYYVQRAGARRRPEV